MNSSDLRLIRAWCNMLPWEEMQDLSTEGEDPKKKVKLLKRRLAVKARYYGKHDQVCLWRGNRRYGFAYCKAVENSLNALERLPDPEPSLVDEITLWFDETTAKAIPSNLKTLVDLKKHMEDWAGGKTELSDGLQRKKLLITAFYKRYESRLGQLPTKRAKKQHEPTLLQCVAPLERIIIPPELDGKQGSNRGGDDCRINADCDIGAIQGWLATKAGSQKTRAAYKKEIERLLLWVLLERRKPFSSLNTEDAAAYRQWLRMLTKDDLEWVSTKPTTADNWKPFYYRMPSKDLESGQVLTPESIKYAVTVISSCMSWLVRQHYLKHNNFEEIKNTPTIKNKPHARMFTAGQIQFILDYARRKAADNKGSRRDLFMLTLGFGTGLRLSELANAKMGDIECHPDETENRYLLNVVGKRNKHRKTSLPNSLVKEIKDYLRYRGFSSRLHALPLDMPVIPSLKGGDKNKPLTPTGLHMALSQFFKKMIADLEGQGEEDRQFIEKLSQASMHWLRHSYGSLLVNELNVPLPYVRDELGHANITTTSLYLHTEEWKRQKTVGDALDRSLEICRLAACTETSDSAS